MALRQASSRRHLAPCPSCNAPSGQLRSLASGSRLEPPGRTSSTHGDRRPIYPWAATRSPSVIVSRDRSKSSIGAGKLPTGVRSSPKLRPRQRRCQFKSGSIGIKNAKQYLRSSSLASSRPRCSSSSAISLGRAGRTSRLSCGRKRVLLLERIRPNSSRNHGSSTRAQADRSDVAENASTGRRLISSTKHRCCRALAASPRRASDSLRSVR